MDKPTTLHKLLDATENRRFQEEVVPIYFVLFSCCCFTRRTGGRLLESNRAEAFSGKNAVYRFLNQSGIRMASIFV